MIADANQVHSTYQPPQIRQKNRSLAGPATYRQKRVRKGVTAKTKKLTELWITRTASAHGRSEEAMCTAGHVKELAYHLEV